MAADIPEFLLLKHELRSTSKFLQVAHILLPNASLQGRVYFNTFLQFICYFRYKTLCKSFPILFLSKLKSFSLSFPIMFACVIPGRPLTTEFQQIDNEKMVLGLDTPQTIRDFTICLLRPDIPQGQGVGVFYSLAPFNHWVFVGSVTLENPTVQFHAPWYGKLEHNCEGLQVGVQLMPLQELVNLNPVSSENLEEKKALESASGIAKNLFQYMASFSQTTGQYRDLGDVVIIPTNCVDQWYGKFLRKHNRDPYFWMRNEHS